MKEKREEGGEGEYLGGKDVSSFDRIPVVRDERVEAILLRELFKEQSSVVMNIPKAGCKCNISHLHSLPSPASLLPLPLLS